ETYTIKFKDLAKGETGFYDIAEKMDFFVQVANAGGEKVVDFSIKGELKTVFWQRVVEKHADNLPTKLLRGYGEARIQILGQTTVLPVEGKRVHIERKGDKAGYAIDGVKEGGGKFEALLRAELDDNLTMSTFLPNRPVKLKESWRFDAKPIAR